MGDIKSTPGSAKIWVLMAAILLLISLGILNQQSTKRFIIALDERASARDLLIEVKSLLSDLQDAETGQRGFLLTGDPRYLEPYIRARQVIDQRLSTIRRLNLKNPENPVDLATLTPLIEEKFGELQQTIDVYKASGLKEALKIVRTDRGKQAMDGIREIVNDRAAQTGGAIERRTEQAHDGAERARITFWLGGIFSVSLLVLAFYWLARETRNTQAANAMAQELNKTLEERVGDRTAQLSRSNEALLKEINERKQIDQRFTLLVKGVKDYAIFMLDPTGHVTTWNEGAERLKGYSEAEILGKHFSLFYTDEERRADRPQHTLEMATRHGTFEEVALRQRKDGSQFWANIVLTALRDDHGTLIGFSKVSRDITERHRAEESLREAKEVLEVKVQERTRELTVANEKLQEVDRLKSEFLATMSHELRTPLNSIIGFTGIIRQGLAGPVNEEQAKQLSMVYISARHLLNLINDLLDLSRIESGKMEVVEERFELSGVLDEVIKTLQPIAAMKGVDIHADPHRPLIVHSDRKKVFQILLNLANNAVKFTENGFVKIRTDARDGNVIISVEDTGIGIKPAQMGLLFEAFRQVEGSAKRNYEGTGLGLYLCKQLVTLLGGNISAKSEYGKGSRFTFHIPQGETV